ncbi:serine hydrolase [Streptococcus ictaluri]|uniref:Serine-type D-Ala-D-Ala carboxypeptidase domain protein n=1 Tax=Streptococcus ictaluri 707-05 TaxID=764299 RepID=G5K0J7_9STRE|nr:serine hydrolase [Streptococcus ictaluri]EHI70485.1 serine-type D-Ala-D-Ala carboxypeptidase domain protein [Streptococcus ictaluri 707-05]
MKKLLTVMLMTFFLTPLTVISTEKSMAFSNTTLYQLRQDVVTANTYYHSLPINPNLFQETEVYTDPELTVVQKRLEPNKELKLKSLLINAHQIPVFELTDGTYLEASRHIVFEDVMISESKTNMTAWAQKKMTVYQEPYVLGVKEANVSFDFGQKLSVQKTAQTQHGTYLYVDGKGWINDLEVSMTDNRMLKVQEMLTQKYQKENYSIFVKQLNTQASAGINADKRMYAASISKLATLYHVQKQLNQGKIRKDKALKYLDKVNHFYGDYDPSGSGKISKTANKEEYSVETLLKAVAQQSDNVATNILGYYICHQYDQSFMNEVRALTGSNWDMEERILSSRAAANMMEAIYYQNGEIISYLSDTEFDNQRISKNITVPVAHKIGDAYDFKHDVAIVYVDTPFIISIMTDQASYDDITNIADDVYTILK